MPRVAGQIDIYKNEAILDAAVEVFAERGLGAPLEDIARRAGVSKQTIYNHYGSKADLMRAVTTRRVDAITAPLQLPGAIDDPEEALAALARSLLAGLVNERALSMTRVMLHRSSELGDMTKAFWESGPLASRAILAEFLAKETEAGRLSVDNPHEAAGYFTGMVLGAHQLGALLGVDTGLTEPAIERAARRAAARFIRAYGV